MPVKINKDHDINISSLNTYLFEVRKDKLLTSDEEKRLSQRIIKGDKRARETLINSNLRLVVKIARGYLTSDMELQDLIQEGNLGLIKAADKFDFQKNVRFSTYASFWIKQSIARAISNKSRMIRLPHRKEEKIRKLDKAEQKLAKDLGRFPFWNEISEETHIEESEIRNIKRLPSKVLSIESGNEESHFSLGNSVEDPKYNPDVILMKKYMREKTREVLEILNEKEKKVLLFRYAFLDGERYTLKEIGKKLEISPETVRQVEIKALRKIRERFTHLRDFLVD